MSRFKFFITDCKFFIFLTLFCFGLAAYSYYRVGFGICVGGWLGVTPILIWHLYYLYVFENYPNSLKLKCATKGWRFALTLSLLLLITSSTFELAHNLAFDLSTALSISVLMTVFGLALAAYLDSNARKKLDIDK